MGTNYNYITSIKFLDEDPINKYNFVKPLIFEPLNKINLLVGQNNSGKSRFLRGLFLTDDFFYKTNKLSGLMINELVENLINDLKKSVFIDGVIQIGNTSDKTFKEFKSKIDNYIGIKNNLIDELQKLLSNSLAGGGAISTSGIPPRNNNTYYINNLVATAQIYLEKLNKLNLNELKVKRLIKYYIPILRGMRPFDEGSKDHYYERTIKDYFKEKIKNENDIKHFVFTGIELYESLKSKLLGEPEERGDVRNFENYLSKNFFDSQSITLIPRDKADTVFIKIGNEPQLPIYNLGDGLQNLIIICYNIFFEKESCIFFLEEPDISMHPGLQRSLIEKMIHDNDHQFFITTHSNHLLDLTIDYPDISVFNFKKEIDGEIIIFKVESKTKNDRNLLIDLGVRNSSVFLVNSTIWVEGITDRLYLRKYLKKYLDDPLDEDKSKVGTFKKFKEDIDFGFIEYQGSNLTHWTFSESNGDEVQIRANFLSGNPIILADGDIVEKGEREKKYKEMLGDKFLVLDCKEIENLIPEKILQLYLEGRYKDKFNDISKIKFSEYSKLKTGLGSYLDKRTIDPSQKVFGEDSTTIKNKINFCERILEIIDGNKEWTLPEVTKEICSKIYNHILESRN